MGLSCVVKVYENCRLHFPCMHKNVIMVAYGKLYVVRARMALIRR